MSELLQSTYLRVSCKENTLSHGRPPEGTETFKENPKSIVFKNSLSYCNMWISYVILTRFITISQSNMDKSTYDKLTPGLLRRSDRKHNYTRATLTLKLGKCTACNNSNSSGNYFTREVVILRANCNKT